MEGMAQTIAELTSARDHMALKLSRLGYSDKEIARIAATGWSCMTADRPWGKE